MAQAQAQAPEPDRKEFVFIHESGDPGPTGEPIYILASLHMDEAILNDVRNHQASFRFHSWLGSWQDGHAWIVDRDRSTWTT
jgi:hypothetical protein